MAALPSAEATRRFSLAATAVSWLVLGYLAWFVAPDWRTAGDVSAPLTRKLLFYHPASAWAAFVGYFVVLVASVAYLRRREAGLDVVARSAAEVGFFLNTIALVTGTIWGSIEWMRTGEQPLVTVMREPKVLVLLVMWFAFAAYLLLRRLVDDPSRRARLSAAFGIIGFAGVPLSFLTSRLLQTSLHPDVVGPGANPDAALPTSAGITLGWSFIAFTFLFAFLFLHRLRLSKIEERLEGIETEMRE